MGSGFFWVTLYFFIWLLYTLSLSLSLSLSHTHTHTHSLNVPNTKSWTTNIKTHCCTIITMHYAIHIYTDKAKIIHPCIELFTLLEHLSSPPVFSGVRVTWSLVLYVCFIDRCLSFCPFSFGHCVVCFSSVYRFWLPLWCLQTLLKLKN
jgi:hypothetical protein